VKQDTNQPDTTVTLVMKPLICKMENVSTIVIPDHINVKLITNVDQMIFLVKNFLLEMTTLTKNVMITHI